MVIEALDQESCDVGKLDFERHDYVLAEPYKANKKVCNDCYYNDGEVHAECIVCDKYKADMEIKE